MISMKNRIYGMLALLFMGSASVMAEGDPFGEYNPHIYSNTMILAGYVCLNGEKLGTEAVVAAYCGNTLRGKQSPNNEGELYLTIGGDYTGDKIHFKVYTGGRVIEVNQDLTYANNATVGSISEPYVITLPAPVVTTPTTEGWATTCLPFNAEVPSGVEVWNATAIENSELVMTKSTGAILPANTPVLIKSDGLTSYEWLSRVADGDITTTASIFTGTTEPTAIAANSVLTLGYRNEGNHEIGFWRFTGTTIPANRAYIKDVPAGVHGVTFRFEDASAIGAALNDKGEMINAVYDLQGRRMDSSQFKAGVCWKKNSKGQIIIIK